MGHRLGVQGLFFAIVLSACVFAAGAATSTATISGPVPSVPVATSTVVGAKPSLPWHQRPELLGLLGPAVTLAIGLFAAYMAFQQIDRQRRNSSDLQKENMRNEFKLEIYRELCKKLDPTIDGLSSVGLYAALAAEEADSAEYQRTLGITPGPLKHHAKEFSDKFADTGNHIAEVIMLIERYWIVQPDLDVFRLALSAGMHDARALHNDILSTMFKWFPIRRSEGSKTGPEIVNVRAVPKEVIEDLRKKGWDFHGSMSMIGGYLDDLRRELQIHLLSGLFDGLVPRRKPADPQQKVVTLDKSEVAALRKHFVENTAWGQQTAQIEGEAHDHFRKRSGQMASNMRDA